MRLAVLGNFSEGCHEPATTVGLLYEKRGFQVLHLDVDLLRFCKDAAIFELIELVLSFLKGVLVVLWEPLR